jgi:hypothetical protein
MNYEEKVNNAGSDEIKKEGLQPENPNTSCSVSLPDDKPAVFVPVEDIQVINRVLNDWELVKRYWNHIKFRSRPPVEL